MKIAFVYAGGREARWEGVKQGTGPKEFFYGAADLPADEVRVLDVPSPHSGFWTGLLDLLIGRFLPARTNAASLLQVLQILPRLRGVDCIVATYVQAALVLGLCRRLGLLKTPVVGIQCGLVNHPMAALRRTVTAFALKGTQTVLFAESERQAMMERFALADELIISGDFGVDLEFWKPDESVQREGFVLAVGNDGRRDYATLLEAAKATGHEFRIVTRLPLPEPLPENVKWIRGDWKGAIVSDDSLRDLYRRAAVVVVPLRDAIQPSGQSVAMQALACGAHVIMTKTRGCWTEPVLTDFVALVPQGDAAALALEIGKGGEVEPDAVRGRLLEAKWESRGFAQRLWCVCSKLSPS